MKFVTAAITAAWLLALGMVPAEATPFVYQFSMPSWEYNTSAYTFGTNALLDITVDNGNSVNTGQLYALSDITSFSVTAIGGTFALTGSSGVVLGTDGAFLTTDTSGVATLDLRSQAFTGAYNFQSGSDLFQIGFVDTFLGGYVPFSLISGSEDAAIIGPTDCAGDNYCGFQVVETSSVPEPITMSLFCSGVIGAFAVRRRKKQA